MNKIKHLLRFLSGKTTALPVLLAVLFTAVTPAFSQTADVRYAGVFYKDIPWGVSGMYCGWSPSTLDVRSNSSNQRSFVATPRPGGNQSVSDPWVSSALIEYDQPFPNTNFNTNKYPNHCLALCMNVVCTNKPMSQSTYSIAFPLQNIRFDIVKYYNNKNVENPEETPAIRTIDLYPNLEGAKCGSYACGGAAAGNPCTSAEYVCDRNICDDWCTSELCSEGRANQCRDASGNTWNFNTSARCYPIADGIGGSTYYQPSTGNPDLCGKYGEKCLIFNNDGTQTNQSIPFCAAWDGSYDISGEFGKTNGNYAFRATVSTDVPGDNIITDKIQFESTIAYPGMNQIPIQVDITNIHTVRSTPSLVGNITAVSAQPYTYAYRLSKDADVRIGIFVASTDDVTTSYAPSLTLTCPSGEFIDFTSYSNYDNWYSGDCCANGSDNRCWTTGGNSIYGLDASGNACTVTYDVNTGTYTHSPADCWPVGQNGAWGSFDVDGAGTIKRGCCTNAASNVGVPAPSSSNITEADIVRTLVDWQPRLGEGMKGKDSDVQITEFDSWDGRNDDGMLMPAGNYVVTLQAKTQDEWPGIDFSRAVTRQLSLDPLKLTDVVATGLTKQSTAYATITYTPTESSKVYWYIYTPGTSFYNDPSTGTTSSGVLTDSSAPTGTEPFILSDAANGATGNPVYVLTEDRLGRANFTSKWDGLCGMDGTVPFHLLQNQVYPVEAVDAAGASLTGTCTSSNGCTYYMPKCVRTYAQNEKMSDGGFCGDTNHPYAVGNVCRETFEFGAPLPDGNYVYALWAEIPYNGCYYNKASNHTSAPIFVANTACDVKQYGGNTQSFTGVKTLKYNVGQVAIERGVVDITIQPVSYSVVGSSPTAYGLDPFIFKYSIARDSNVVAKITNTAGIDVKYLTPEAGITQVAQQMNTITWDGRNDAGRMVTPGTYMFVVETKDAMFPAVTNRAAAVFPVDMYRVVDMSTTDVYGDSNAKATLSYTLSKPMNVQVNIYNKDVVIPDYNTTTGDYNDITITSTATGTGYSDVLPAIGYSLTLSDGSTFGPTAVVEGTNTTYSTTYRDTVVARYNPTYNGTSSICNPANPMSCHYIIEVTREYFTTSATSTAAWPPRLCDLVTDAAAFTGGHVDPAKNPKCIYVRDTTFTNYPADAAQAASGVVDVRLQPIKTFERNALKPGDGLQITEEWDALYFYNPSNCPAGSTNIRNCSYEMLPDGQYPYYVAARSNEAFSRYYYDSAVDTSLTGYTINGQPFTSASDVQYQEYLYTTEKPVNKINVTRGSVYFLDGSIAVYPNAPQLFNVSSGPVFIPPYEINFSISRAATVEVAIVALQDNVCNPDPTVHQDLKNNKAGDVCKYLSTTRILDTGDFDPNIVRKVYWDGTDNNGYYVRSGIYEVRLTAKNYPDETLYQPTVKSVSLNTNILKVFDLLEADGYAISQRGTDMKIGYQLSVPMKVGIQIFKPGTTIYDYQKGTLRNPTTGREVKDIREVLVKAITGIRPATTLIEEVWDGTDYANQEVPDGTYPFRFVTSTNSANIDSVTGEILFGDDQSTNPADWKVNYVSDTYEYQNLHKATIAIGDGRFVCEDWEKTVFFYPNPFNDASKGTLEITKMPVPGTVSIKYYNLAGDLVRDSNYTCVDANNYEVTMGDNLSFQPDNNVSTTVTTINNIRNAALRCKWDRTNQHGKKVARGVYFGLVDFKARMGREHCQKVVKILIP
ncbi:MAG: hypothetical protein MJ053_02985 [Elusimicrobiaceae bacterium]|nr:hypothetical protein [Elusimicrobiaceae bacterium]